MRLAILGLFSAVVLLGASGCAHHGMRGASCASGGCQVVSDNCGDCGSAACKSCSGWNLMAKLFRCNRECQSDCEQCGSPDCRPPRGGRCGGLCDGGGPPYSAYTTHGPRDFFATSPRPLGP